MKSPAAGGRVRLQKFISDAGVASRRRAEELILEGRVLVNDAIVDGLPAFIDPRGDVVIVDGSRIRVEAPRYYVVHKPKGVVCTNRDPAGRIRAVDLMPPDAPRVFPVGRLDADSSGLLLMTNDGELAQRITHPRYGISKEYRVEVAGRVPPDLPERMRAGVYLSDGKARASAVRIVHTGANESVLMITLREGRNRQVRRMLARLGFPARTLKRVQIGPISVGGLPIGAVRELSSREVRALQDAAVHAEQQSTLRPAPRRRRKAGAAPSGGSGGRPGSGSARSAGPKAQRRRRMIT